MKNYNIYLNTGFGNEQQMLNDDPIAAESEAEALALFEQHVRDTFDPDYNLEGNVYAVEE